MKGSKMNIRRYSATVAASAALLGLVLTGCSSPGSSGEKTELSMLVNITPNLTEEFWNDLVAPFEAANPNIDVKIQSPAGSVIETLPTLLASGDVPDIVQTITPTAELAPELVDLSEYKWAQESPLAEQYKMDGKILTAGIGFQLQGLVFYNKQAFADAGIDAPPTTMEEYEADLSKLKEAGWTPIQTGGEWMTQLAMQYAAVPTVIGENPNWYPEISSGELVWSDSYRTSVERYANWVANGYIPADAVGVKYPEAEASFLAGKTAMYPIGSWFLNAEASAAEKPEIGVFAAPAVKGVTPAQIAGLASPYIIMKASPNQDAAAKLVEFLVTDKEAVIAQLKVDGNFRDGYEYETSALGKQLLQIIADTPAESFTPAGDGYGDRRVPAGYEAELNTQTQGLLTGGSVEEMLAAMDAWFKANL